MAYSPIRDKHTILRLNHATIAAATRGSWSFFAYTGYSVHFLHENGPKLMRQGRIELVTPGLYSFSFRCQVSAGAAVSIDLRDNDAVSVRSANAATLWNWITIPQEYFVITPDMAAREWPQYWVYYLIDGAGSSAITNAQTTICYHGPVI